MYSHEHLGSASDQDDEPFIVNSRLSDQQKFTLPDKERQDSLPGSSFSRTALVSALILFSATTVMVLARSVDYVLYVR